MLYTHPNCCQDGNLVDPLNITGAQLPAPAEDANTKHK